MYDYERPVVLHDLRIDRGHNHVIPARVSEDVQMDGVRGMSCGGWMCVTMVVAVIADGDKDFP